MTCLELFDYLDRYHAGTLSRPEAEAVEQHLLGCADCAADFRFQRSLKGKTVALPGAIAPEHELWPGIRDQIRGTAAVAAGVRPRWQRTPWLIAATIALMGPVIRGHDAAHSHRQSTAIRWHPGLPVHRARYRQAADELLRSLQAHRKELGEPAFKVIEQNLHIIDQAIQETQAALASDPHNQQVTQLLWASYEKKIDLLQRAAHNVES
jgi:hypothetical protein